MTISVISNGHCLNNYATLLPNVKSTQPLDALALQRPVTHSRALHIVQPLGATDRAMEQAPIDGLEGYTGPANRLPKCSWRALGSSSTAYYDQLEQWSEQFSPEHGREQAGSVDGSRV